MKRIYLLFLLTLLFSACQKPVEQLEGLRLADGQSSEIVFDGFASTQSISFVSDYVWMIGIEEECDWFEVSPMYGQAGEATIEISVSDYFAGANAQPLSGSFTITGGDYQLEISVVQNSAEDPAANWINVPDDNFRNYLLENFDTDGDGHISYDEAEVVERIECPSLEIASLEGIKNFTSLKYLDCSYNVITGDFDLSGMISLEEAYIDHNMHTTINLSGCSELKIVEANDNVEHTEDYRSIFHTVGINVDGCSELLYLELTDNAIEEIDLSDCAKLQVLRMTWNNLKEIDVTSCPELTHLYVRKNLELAGTLDVSKNTKLVELWCAESSLTGVQFASSHPDLTTIISYDSKISSLDLSGCPALTKLEAHSMMLTELDVTKCPELDYLWLKFNQITELDLTQNTKLRELQMGYNLVETLDFSNCPLLQTLEVVSNRLTSVNLSNCTNLINMDLGMNNLTSVDVSDCDKLFQLALYENQLTSLDVSGKTELGVLSVSMNQLETLNITNCPNITLLYADNNKLTHLDLRQNTELMEVALGMNELVELRVDGLKNMSICEFNNNKLERLNLKGCKSIAELYVQKNPIAYLSVYDCEALRQLDMRSTKIKSMDLSNNPNAAFLFATENPQLKTVYIMPDAVYSALSVDEHVEIWYRNPGVYDDVENGNWGDEDINPWE